MSINPRLDFYRFSLNHKNSVKKTFRNFAIDELDLKPDSTDEKILQSIFVHFISSLEKDIAKDDKLKKEIALIDDPLVNIHYDKKPRYLSNKNIICGVINGGPYGRDGILSNIFNLKDNSRLGKEKSVLHYFFFLLYTPTDHDEGCFIIHSNGAGENITNIFRNYIANIFKGNNYNKVQCELFCPKSFQDEFRDGAILKNITFKESFIENISNSSGISHLMSEYDIKIEAIPKNKSISITDAYKIVNYLRSKIFGNITNHKKLEEFEKTKMLSENPETNSQKVFEWNKKDGDFIPVVYLENRIIKSNDDGTPDFDELKDFCLNIFEEQVLPEIRPDLYVTRTQKIP